jgi:tetratricopeptide (TPR) repeat protein
LDKLGLHDEAYEYYKKSIRVNPEYPQAYSNLMSNRMKSGQLDSAVYFGEISVKLADNIGDNGVLCALYHKVGLYDKRDSLYSILKHLEYVNLDKLEEVIAPR